MRLFACNSLLGIAFRLVRLSNRRDCLVTARSCKLPRIASQRASSFIRFSFQNPIFLRKTFVSHEKSGKKKKAAAKNGSIIFSSACRFLFGFLRDEFLSRLTTTTTGKRAKVWSGRRSRGWQRRGEKGPFKDNRKMASQTGKEFVENWDLTQTLGEGAYGE